MKKIILILGCFCLVIFNPVFTQSANDSKTEQVGEEKVHACKKGNVEEQNPIACKNKGADSKCCKKGLKTEEEKAQCKNKEKCGGKCKDKGGKSSWWKFW
ncbi:MAG: hypothetical protein H8E60_06800 [Candidatus Marinimicrobia bacterium]|nr:hypothetical protein [Candidatus Neomarinimicrobiota bacterium]